VARFAVPLAAYYAVTLVLPLANGAGSNDAFAKHAGVVLVIPPVMIGLMCALRYFFWRRI
jgi:hypothetical protein